MTADTTAPAKKELFATVYGVEADTPLGPWLAYYRAEVGNNQNRKPLSAQELPELAKLLKKAGVTTVRNPHEAERPYLKNTRKSKMAPDQFQRLKLMVEGLKADDFPALMAPTPV